MSRRRDPLRLSSHWHVDYRIETDLPEDTIIGANFLTNVAFAAVTLATVLLFSWAVYRTVLLRHQIAAWKQRIEDSRTEVREIQRMQREYVADASKIDRAYAAIRPSLFVSEFLDVLGRTLPSQATVDTVEWNSDGGVVVIRGYLRESPAAAPAVVGGYIETLRNEPKFNRFRRIWVSDMLRKSEEIQSFVITFWVQPLPPL